MRTISSSELDSNVNILIDRLYLKKNLDCEHLTISISLGLLGDEFLYNKLPILLWHRMCGDYKHKYHFTVNVTDYFVLARELRRWTYITDIVDLVSVSIRPLQDTTSDNFFHVLKEQLPKGVKLGINYLASGELDSEADAVEQRNLFRNVLDGTEQDLIHQVYFILEKGRVSRWNKFGRALENLLSQSIGRVNQRRKMYKRVTIDRCVRDMLSSKQVCSAGIDKIHIWPNGEVTACPYDSFGNYKVDNIYETAHFRNFPMGFCDNCPAKPPVGITHPIYSGARMRNLISSFR